MERKQTGIVKAFNKNKGFGFVYFSTDHGIREIFFHYSGLNPSCREILQDGDEVSFLIVKGKKGFEAIDISKRNSNLDDLKGSPIDKA